MTSGAEAKGPASQEPVLSQQELDPKVRGLWSEFGLAFKEIPKFQQGLARVFFSPGSILRRKNGLTVMFNKGLDGWVVRSYLEEEDRTLSECLKITAYPIEPTQGLKRIRIVTLRIPYLSDRAKSEQDIDISYDQRTLLVASTPTDVHQDKTASAIAGAEKMLVDLKSTS